MLPVRASNSTRCISTVFERFGGNTYELRVLSNTIQ
jgi:hypothetical protein